MSYGSSKVSSSGSSSFLSGSGSSGRSGGGGGGSSSMSSMSSMSSSSCSCNFILDVNLLNNDSFVFYITNLSECDLTITSVTYATGETVTIDNVLPTTVSSGGIRSIAASETFDVRGRTVYVGTDHCGVITFEVPLS